MKNVVTLLCVLLISTICFAQNNPIPSKWKVIKIGAAFGSDMDMVSGLDFNYLMQTAKGIDGSQYSDIEFRNDDYYLAICENPQLRLFATLEVPGMKNTELNVGLNGVFNRLDGVYYNNWEGYNPNNQNYVHEYVSVTTMTNELSLETSFIRKLPFLKYVNFYGGIGTNLGFSFAGQLDVNGHLEKKSVDQNANRSLSDIAAGETYYDYIYETADVKDAFHQRLFLQAGLGFVVKKRLELGMDFRRGIGYRAIKGAPTKMINLHSVNVVAKWILK